MIRRSYSSTGGRESFRRFNFSASHPTCQEASVRMFRLKVYIPQLSSNIIFPSFIISRMGLSLSQRCALITSVAVAVSNLASADSDNNGTWLYPDPSTTPTFNYLDTLNASWTSDFSTPWLHLWCGVINGNSSSPVLGECMTESSFLSIPGIRVLTTTWQCTINQRPQPVVSIFLSTMPSNHSAATSNSPASQPSDWGLRMP